MSEKAVSIHVSSSWEAINQVPLEESVTLVQFSDVKRDEDSSPTDMVELETCVLLSQPVEENGNQNFSPQPCTLSLRLESAPQDFITSIIIVCEARVIEVHGACNEYLGTIPADLIDTIDDTTIYSADINLSQLTRECTLKFARLGRPSDMWLYGVKVIWKSSGDLQKNNVQSTGLNLETVEQRLRESQTQLSGRAESCKQFLKMYSSLNESKQPLPDALSLLSFLPALRKAGNGPTDSFLKSATQTLPSFSGAAHSSSIFKPREEMCPGSSSLFCEKCSDQFDRIIEKRLLLMENRIMKALDDKVNALQHHQDNQFQNLLDLLLENKDSGRLKSKENVSDGMPTLSCNSKLEKVLSQFLDQQEENGAKKVPENMEDCNMLSSRLMAYQLKAMSLEAANRSSLDSNGHTTISNSS